MLARPRQIVLSLLVVVPAVLLVSADRAGGQSTPPASERDPNPATLEESDP